MTTGELPPPEGESPPPSPGALRADRFRAFQILAGLGLISAVAGSVLSVSVTVALREPLRTLSQWPAAVALLALSRLWVLALVPLASWVMGRITRVPPAAGAALIAGWGEVLYLGIDLAMGGWPNVHGNRLWLGGRVLTLAVGILLGTLAARHGRARALRATARLEAEAQATRARYQAWLDAEQGRPPGAPGSSGPGSGGPAA